MECSADMPGNTTLTESCFKLFITCYGCMRWLLRSDIMNDVIKEADAGLTWAVIGDMRPLCAHVTWQIWVWNQERHQPV